MTRFLDILAKPSVGYSLVILALLAFLPGTQGGYVHDDTMLITNQPHVTRGIDGIPAILTSDAFVAIYEDGKSSLNTGRYRPLSLVTFAVEHEFAPGNAPLQRTVNFLFHALLGLLLLAFLRRWFLPGQAVQALVITLLFLLHPLHAEVVANIKSRDELLSFLFILLTLDAAFRACEPRRAMGMLFWWLVAAGFLLLALLSKEYAVAFLILLPALLWIRRVPIRRWALPCVFVVLVPVVAYIALRLNATGTRILELSPSPTREPYHSATLIEGLATKIELLGLMARRLLWPDPLSYNHFFIQFPFRTLDSVLPWIAFAGYAGISLLALFWTACRKSAAVPLLFFLGFLAPISNLLVDVGTPMADRLLFHASFGFIWAIVALCALGLRRVPVLKWPVGVLAVAVLLFAGVRVAQRTAEWQTQDRLFIADLPRAPYSPVIQSNAGSEYLGRRQPEKGYPCLAKATEMYPNYGDAWLNRSVSEEMLGRVEEAEKSLREAARLQPWNPNLQEVDKILWGHYYLHGLKAGKAGDVNLALKRFQRAHDLGDTRADLLYCLGGAMIETGRAGDAIFMMAESARKSPRGTFKPWSGFEAIPLPNYKIQKKD